MEASDGETSQAEPDLQVAAVRIGEIEKFFEVGVAIGVRIRVVVGRVRKQTVLFLPSIRHAIAVGVGWRRGGFELWPAAYLRLRVDYASRAGGHVSHHTGVYRIASWNDYSARSGRRQSRLFRW